MTVLIVFVSCIVMIEAMGIFLAVIDSWRHPQFLPRKIRKCAIAIAAITLWLIATRDSTTVVIYSFAVAGLGTWIAHYLPRAASRLSDMTNRKQKNPRQAGDTDHLEG